MGLNHEKNIEIKKFSDTPPLGGATVVSSLDPLLNAIGGLHLWDTGDPQTVVMKFKSRYSSMDQGLNYLHATQTL